MTMTDTHSRAQWVALSLIPGVGRITLDRLLDHFGTLDAVCAAEEDDLRAVPGIGPKTAAAIRAVDVDAAAAEIVAWGADGIGLALHCDPGYPPALFPLDDAPPVLFWRGMALPDEMSPGVALVGTRSPTRSGEQRARALAGAFAAQGWIVVSGLAAGIDTAAHLGALNAGGVTLAVSGCGVRVIYPPQNRDLAARIMDQGALIAEVHPDAPPNSPALVARNRLISGLSRVVIVVESSPTSGTRHAARFAARQDRPVYALDDGSAGNRALIEDGAQPLPVTEDAAALVELVLAGGV